MKEVLLNIILSHFEVNKADLFNPKITRGIPAEARMMLFYLSYKNISDNKKAIADMWKRKSANSIRHAVEQADYFITIKHLSFTNNLTICQGKIDSYVEQQRKIK